MTLTQTLLHAQVFIKVTMAAELGDDIVPEVMSVFTAESFAAQTLRRRKNRNRNSFPCVHHQMASIPSSFNNTKMEVLQNLHNDLQTIRSRAFYFPDAMENVTEDEEEKLETRTNITDSDYKLYDYKSPEEPAGKTQWPLLQQFLALLTKRLHHNRRDYRSYFSQIILPSLFVCIAMACILTKPVMESQSPIQLTPSLYEPWSSSFVRCVCLFVSSS